MVCGTGQLSSVNSPACPSETNRVSYHPFDTAAHVFLFASLTHQPVHRAQIEYFFSFGCPTHSINLPDTAAGFRQFPPNLDFGHNNEQHKHTMMGPARVPVPNETNCIHPAKLVHRTPAQANGMRSGRTYMPGDIVICAFTHCTVRSID